MNVKEPQNLIDVLTRLDEKLPLPQFNDRKFRRHTVRANAIIESITHNIDLLPISIQIRDISQTGIGFVFDKELPINSIWRLRFHNDNFIIGQQPILITHQRLIQAGLYLLGAHFIIEPGLLNNLGVPTEEIYEDTQANNVHAQDADFLPPDQI